MIEKLEEYGRFLFGWAFRAMQSEMTMQESQMCIRDSCWSKWFHSNREWRNGGKTSYPYVAG